MRIYIDCTTTFLVGRNTGVQRVVKNVTINAASMSNNTLDLECLPVIFFNGYFFEIRSLLDKPPLIIKLIRLVFRLGTFIRNILKNLYSSKSGKLSKIFYAVLLLFFRNKIKKVKFNSGDVLLIADSFWSTYKAILPELPKLRDKNISIGLIFYDLIPLRHPEFCDSNHVENFYNAINSLLPLVDFTISISKTARDDLISFIKDSRLETAAKHDYFILGADINSKKESADFSKRIIEIFRGMPTYLVVGTLEPRKNHRHVLESFDKMWNSGAKIKLLLIGRIGWKIDLFMKLMIGHPQYGKMLFHVADATDAELEEAYQLSEALIAASVTEGFDLPVVEALHYGKPVIASDIPVHREIGGSKISYFSLNNPFSLADILKEKKYKKPPDNFHWPDWKESSEMLIDKVKLLSRTPNHS